MEITIAPDGNDDDDEDDVEEESENFQPALVRHVAALKPVRRCRNFWGTILALHAVVNF